MEWRELSPIFLQTLYIASQLLPGLLGQVKTTLQLAPSSVPSIEGATSYRLSPIFLDYDSPLSGPVTQQQDSRTQLKELQAGRLVMVLLQCLATWGSHQFIWVKTLSRKRKSCTWLKIIQMIRVNSWLIQEWYKSKKFTVVSNWQPYLGPISYTRDELIMVDVSCNESIL